MDKFTPCSIFSGELLMAAWLIWSGAFIVIWLPGVLLHRLLRLRAAPDWLVALAVQIGLGLAFWPLLLLWSTLVGWHWTPLTAQITAVALMAAGGGALWWSRGASPTRINATPGVDAIPDARWERFRPQLTGTLSRRAAQFRRQGIWLALFGCVLAITLATRALHVRGLALPVWVDPLHHVMIVRLLLAEGRVPPTFDPVIAGGVFNYHWGYHAVVAWMAWTLGVRDGFAVADLMLHASQLLNALTVLMAYAGGRILFASRRAGLLAAASVGVVSWFPAYFLSWGRYTHMTGVLLMAPIMIMSWQMRAGAHPRRVTAAALLLGGLALIHVRVALLLALLIGLLALLFLAQRRWRALMAWLAAAGGALVLTLPWWLWLWQSAFVRAIITPRLDGNAVWPASLPDWGLVWAPRNDLLIATTSGGLSLLMNWQRVDAPAALAGAVWLALLIGATAWAWRRPTLRQPTHRAWAGWLLMALWVAGSALLLQANRLGLPAMRFIHVNAGIMTLFAPLGLATGGLLAWLLGLLARPRFAPLVTGVAVIGISLWGANGMTAIVNPATILATPADRAALAWVRNNTPPDARFAVNTRQWMEGIYAGSDGGYWIPVLTEWASILPPVLYASALPRAEVVEMNALLARLAAARNLDDTALRTDLAAQGVTHLYVRDGGGALQPAEIDGREFVELLYRQDGVSIYALRLAAP